MSLGSLTLLLDLLLDEDPDMLRFCGNVGINLGSQGRGASLKYDDCKHSSAVALFFGSYMNRKLSNRRPAADIHGNLVLRLL